MNLGENIYHLRKEKNLSQDELAAALEVSRQSVSKWENNSAVPELEKLVKMSELFGVTLDELVGQPQNAQTSAPAPEVPEPKIIYVEKPVFPQFSRQHLIGILLLVGAILYAILLYNGRFGMEETLFLVLPVALFGVTFLLTKHALFYSGWVAAFGYWLYIFVLFHRWEEQTVLLWLGVAIVAGMYLWSIRIHRKGILRIPTAVWIVGTLVLAGLGVLLIMNTLPPIHITGSAITAVPVESGP